VQTRAIVLMDLWMPTMNGETAVEAIRFFEKTMELPRSFITITSASAIGTKELDVQRQLQKPILFQSLEEAITAFRNEQ
jgi:CheY-like chemotaxis protein